MPHTCPIQAMLKSRQWLANNKERKKEGEARRKQQVQNQKTTADEMVALFQKAAYAKIAK